MDIDGISGYPAILDFVPSAGSGPVEGSAGQISGEDGGFWTHRCSQVPQLKGRLIMILR